MSLSVLGDNQLVGHTLCNHLGTKSAKHISRSETHASTFGKGAGDYCYGLPTAVNAAF
ncbi:hypothetical protein [Nostoc sp.]|uniref:hypothetical protein n=1 Tax=Nostoc sp. TaxID=1180 RepID=UPI002FF536FD